VHQQPIKQDKKFDEVKYVIYSGHDWTVSQHLLFLDAANGNFTNLPFAAAVNYELHSTETCSQPECFWVEVTYNGEPQLFVKECKNAGKCTYVEFLSMLDKKGFVDTSSRYRNECQTPWSPPTLGFLQ